MTEKMMRIADGELTPEARTYENIKTMIRYGGDPDNPIVLISETDDTIVVGTHADHDGEFMIGGDNVRSLVRGLEGKKGKPVEVVACFPEQVREKHPDLNIVGDWPHVTGSVNRGPVAAVAESLLGVKVEFVGDGGEMVVFSDPDHPAPRLPEGHELDAIHREAARFVPMWVDAA